MIRDDVEGRAKTDRGKVKRAVGHLADDWELHNEGTVE